MSATLLILDLDGTVRESTVEDQPCPNRPGEQRVLPGAAEAIKAHIDAGGKLAFATNQGGIGLGYMTELAFHATCAELSDLLHAAGAPPLDVNQRAPVWFCPHRPDAGCFCRKPEPGLLLKAMLKANVRPSDTLFVGDRECDKHAADAAGCRFMWAHDWRHQTTT